MDEKGTVYLTRDKGWADSLRAYKVLLDGEEVYKIKQGGSYQFNASPGPHELYLKIDWCRSNKIQFSIENNQSIKFTCRSNLRGWRILLMYIFIFMPSKWIVLEKEKSN